MTNLQQIAPRPQQNAPTKGKPRGKPWLKGQSGNPQGGRIRSRRIDALYADLAADLGGASTLTAVQNTLVRQAARMLARAERERDAEHCVRLTNCASRLLASLRNGRRKPAAPSLEAHLDKLAREHAGDVVVDDEADAPLDAESEAVA
jgi:hypothetical protein